jgi:aminoglycoside phosphotransferase (APT) family kinase protein
VDVLSLPRVDPERLLCVLREATGCARLEFEEEPRTLAVGGEAVVDSFRLRDAPEAFSGPLVLRRVLMLKDPEQVRWEAAVHSALAETGFPVPRVLLAEASPEPLGAGFLVAARVPGERPLDEVTRPAALLSRPSRLPALFRDAMVRVPRLLGEMQARLHDLDPAPLRRQLQASGFDPERIGFPARLEGIERRVAAARLEGLAPGLEWLRAQHPEPRDSVVCHGDLVFTNLHVEAGRVTGVFDWSHVALAEPEFDVAATLARLASSIPNVPRLLRGAFRLAQARLVRGYLASYRKRRELDTARLRYYECHWILHELSWSGERLRAGAVPDDAIEHRWLHPGTIASGIDRFAETSGVRLTPRLPDAGSPGAG